MSKSRQVPHPLLTPVVLETGTGVRKRSEWAPSSWCRRWIQVFPRNVCRACVCGCEHKNTEGVIDCTHVHYLVTVGMVKSVEKKKRVPGQFTVKYQTKTKQWRLRDRQVLDTSCWQSWCWKQWTLLCILVLLVKVSTSVVHKFWPDESFFYWQLIKP